MDKKKKRSIAILLCEQDTILLLEAKLVLKVNKEIMNLK